MHQVNETSSYKLCDLPDRQTKDFHVTLQNVLRVKRTASRLVSSLDGFYVFCRSAPVRVVNKHFWNVCKSKSHTVSSIDDIDVISRSQRCAGADEGVVASNVIEHRPLECQVTPDHEVKKLRRRGKRHSVFSCSDGYTSIIFTVRFDATPECVELTIGFEGMLNGVKPIARYDAIIVRENDHVALSKVQACVECNGLPRLCLDCMTYGHPAARFGRLNYV